MIMIIAYLAGILIMSFASWHLAGSVQNSIKQDSRFWLRMNALASLWMAPLAASPLAWALADKGLQKIAALLMVSITASMLIVGIGRMVVMQNMERLARVRRRS